MLSILLLFSPSSMPTITLRNGVKMPMLLFGTPNCKLGDDACHAEVAAEINLALPIGFDGIDTADHYHNELGIAQSDLHGSSAWVTSKVEACNNSYVKLGSCAADTRAVFMRNLAQLNASSVSLMLLHAPTATRGGSHVYPGPQFDAPVCNCSARAACEAMQQQWGAMEALYSEGKAKAIGVSNYCPACLDCLAETSKVTPMVNQILMHVGMRALGNASALPAECTRRGIVAQAYSPLGSGSSKVLDAALTKKIGAAHDVSSAQVALRWLIQSGYPAITAASSKQAAYMREDVAIFNWTLTSSEMAELKVATFADESPVKMMCY